MTENKLSDVTVTEPMRMIYAGRYAYAVPESLILKNYRVKVKPANQKEGHKTSYIEIIETPWQTENRQLEFEQSYQEALAQKNGYWAKKPVPDYMKGVNYAENLDARAFFGRPSVCAAYNPGSADMPVECFVSMPQGVLHFKESRMYRRWIPQCSDIERPAAQLMPYYHWGNPEPEEQDVFYTAHGYVSGYPAGRESAAILLGNNSGFEVGIETYAPKEYEVSSSKVKRVASLSGVRASILRERGFERGGVLFYELIYRLTLDDDDTVNFVLLSHNGHASSPKDPSLKIITDCEWEDLEKTLPLWNSIVQGMRPVGVVAQPAAGR